MSYALIHYTKTNRMFQHYFLFSRDLLLWAILCTSSVPAVKFFFTCMLLCRCTKLMKLGNISTVKLHKAKIILLTLFLINTLFVEAYIYYFIKYKKIWTNWHLTLLQTRWKHLCIYGNSIICRSINQIFEITGQLTFPLFLYTCLDWGVRLPPAPIKDVTNVPWDLLDYCSYSDSLKSPLQKIQWLMA